MPTPTVLTLADPLRQRLAELATAAYPAEACGLLVGRRRGASLDVVRLEGTTNLARRHDRFELDPVAWLRGHDRAAADGLDVVGTWHTHPDLPAQPSRQDRDGAWRDHAQLIGSVSRAGLGELRAYWPAAGGDGAAMHEVAVG